MVNDVASFFTLKIRPTNVDDLNCVTVIILPFMHMINTYIHNKLTRSVNAIIKTII